MNNGRQQKPKKILYFMNCNTLSVIYLYFYFNITGKSIFAKTEKNATHTSIN